MSHVEITQHHGYHFLWINDDLWMWDVPQEIAAQRELAEQASGTVLVAGYGLGLLQSMLVVSHKVRDVLTVEVYQEVLTANERLFGRLWGRTEVGDFFNLPEDGTKYDTIVGDVWLEVNKVYLDGFLRFRNKAEKLLQPNGKVVAWGQDCFEMWESKLCSQ